MTKTLFDKDRAVVSHKGDFVRTYNRYGNENEQSFQRQVLKENKRSLR